MRNPIIEMTIIFKLKDLVIGSTSEGSDLPNILVGKWQKSEDSILRMYQ